MEEIEKLWDEIETEDVGQKRYLMYNVFDLLLEELYDLNETSLPSADRRVKDLQENEGYMYKLSQDFLTSSSTMEKEQVLEKMIDFVKRKRN